MISRRSRAIIAAVALTLVMAMPAAAVSSSATETLTVSSQITLTGVPATLDYGTALGGALVGAGSFTTNVSSNNATGWKLSVSATDLTSGSGSIPATARKLKVLNLVAPAGVTVTAAYNNVDGAITAANTPIVIVSSTGALTAAADLSPKVQVPAGAAAGTYTGTFTVIAENNP